MKAVGSLHVQDSFQKYGWLNIFPNACQQEFD